MSTVEVSISHISQNNLKTAEITTVSVSTQPKLLMYVLCIFWKLETPHWWCFFPAGHTNAPESVRKEGRTALGLILNLRITGHSKYQATTVCMVVTGFTVGNYTCITRSMNIDVII